MSDNDYVQGSMDVSAQKSMYDAVMSIGGRWGTAFSLALTMFFTALLINWGLGGAIISSIVVFFAVAWIAKTFFMH